MCCILRHKWDIIKNKERWRQHGNTKCERPFSVELPSGIKTLDTLADEEFDKMMQAGLEQSRFF